MSILKLGPLKAIVLSSIAPIEPKSTSIFILSIIFSATLNLLRTLIEEGKGSGNLKRISYLLVLLFKFKLTQVTNWSSPKLRTKSLKNW